MNDLISRHATIDIVSGYAEKFNGYIGSPNDSEVYAYARGLLLGIERNINAVPSADAVPVVHGEWIHGREVSRDYVGDVCVCIRYENWWCSECKYTVDWGKPLWNYCPNCGACMTTKTPIDKDELAY